MKKIQFLFLYLSMCIISCKSNDKSTWAYEFSGGKIEEFEIVLGKDTTIVCKGGTKLHIFKNTFIGATSNFKIQVREALTKADMMSFGLSTNADDNILLESSGMIQLKPIGNLNVKINVDAPIKVEMPTRYINEKTRLYTEGEQKGGTFTWKEADKLNNDAILGKIELGGKLFDANCANCHSKILEDKLTGPPLAHISKKRPMQWLIDFTRNSQAMIGKSMKLATLDSFIIRDIYSLCIWNEYKPTAMSPFPNLTDSEIVSIYNYIENESEKMNYEIKKDNCSGEESIKRELNNLKISQNQNQDLFYSIANSFQIKDFEWHNCDSPIENSENIEFTVDYNLKEIEGIDLYLVYKKRNILYHWYLRANVQIPQEEVILIAFGKTKTGVQFYQKNVKIEKQNKFYLDFKPKSLEEIQKEIAKL